MRDGPRDPGSATIPLIGRDAERARLIELVRSGTWIVNVCGPTGVGKTALVRSGLAVLRAERAAVLEVDLSRRDGPVRWPETLARSIGVPAGSDEVHAALRIELAGRTLLVLDDAEGQVSLDQLRGLVEECPGLQVIVVTLARLTPTDHVDVAPLDPADAERLFCARAGETDPGFHLGAETTPLVHRICAALEGLPLALELAAARLPSVPLGFLAKEIGEQRALAVLSHRAGGRLGVRDCLEATCTHLDPSTAKLFTLTGVFAGSFSHAAMTAVAGENASELFDDLSRLVDLRLLEQTFDDDGGMHLRVPRLVRELAEQRLRASGAYDEAATRHAAHFRLIARTAAQFVADGYDERALRTFAGQAAEVDAALAWLERHDPPAALRLAADLAPMTGQLGGHEHCRAALDRLLREVGDDVDDATRRDALLSAAALGLMSKTAAADGEITQARLSEGTTLARALDEPLPLLRALDLTVLAITQTGDLEHAGLAAKDGIEIARRLGHARWRARFEAWSGMLLHLVHQPQQAAAMGEQALQRALRAGDDRGVVIAALLLHPLPPEAGVDRTRLPSLETLLAIAERLDDVQTQSHLFAQLAAAALDASDPREAARWVLRRLELMVRSSAWHGAGFVLMQTVRVASLRHDDKSAARLHGAVASMLEVLFGAMAPAAVTSYQSCVAAARERLGSQLFDRLAADNGPQPWEEALVVAKSYLLSVTEPMPMPTVAAEAAEGSTTGHDLTRRELEVLALIAAGRRNKEIAAALHLSPKTVMHHSVAIYRKLGVRGRAEAAVLAQSEGLTDHP